MFNLKTWMVALDLSQMDDTMVNYTHYLASILKPSNIVFVHVNQHYEIPDGVHEFLDNGSDEEEVRKVLKSTISKYFKNDTHVSLQIYEGRPHFQLWRESYENGVDLLIVGAKPKHKGRGIFPKKLARNSFCSVLFVPENAKSQIKNILIPTDFSKDSKKALDMGVALSSKLHNPLIFCYHAFDLPYAHSLTGLSRTEYIDIVRDNSEDKFLTFVKDINEDISITPVLALHEHVTIAEHIEEVASKSSADFIIMSAGGGSELSKIFLGSETVAMAGREKDIPLLILKTKSTKVNLWDIVSNL